MWKILMKKVACEQALLFGRAKRVSRERASEARPNRRACSQAMKKVGLIQVIGARLPEVDLGKDTRKSTLSFSSQK